MARSNDGGVQLIILGDSLLMLFVEKHDEKVDLILTALSEVTHTFVQLQQKSQLKV